MKIPFKMASGFVVVLVAALLICGCRHNDTLSARQGEIEALIPFTPDSAYFILEEYNAKGSFSDKDNAVYWLLISKLTYEGGCDMAREKGSIVKGLSGAVDYFRSVDDRNNLVKALLYKGMSLKDKREYADAMVALQEALESVDDNNFFYRGKIFSLMGEISYETGDFSAYSDYLRDAWKSLVAMDSLEYMHNSQLVYGVALEKTQRKGEGMALMREVLDGAVIRGDTVMMKKICSVLGNDCLEKDDYAGAFSYYSTLASAGGVERMSENEISSYIKSMINAGIERDSIESVAGVMSRLYGADCLPYDYYKYKNDYKQAFRSLYKDYIRIKDERRKESLRYGKRMSHGFYMTNPEYGLESDEWGIMDAVALICFLSFIALLMVLSIMSFKKRSLGERGILQLVGKLTSDNHIDTDGAADVYVGMKQDKRIYLLGCRENNQEATEITYNEPVSESSDIEECVEVSESHPINLLRNVFKRLDVLYATFYRSEEPENRKKQIVARMQAEIDILRESPEFLEELEDEINFLTNNLLNDIYLSMARISVRQRRLVAFFYFGLSTDTICLLLDIKPGALYNRKNRLVEAIKKSKSMRKGELVSIITNS